MRINSIQLRRIIDSRTQPTIEAEINESYGKAPSGASTGRHEAKCHVPKHLDELEKLLKNKLEGRNLTQKEFDQKLEEIDGSDDFSRLGAAAIASSFAFKNAAGFQHTKKFPLPLSNVIGGGEHGGQTTIQEFLVLPVNAKTFPEALETNTKIYQELKNQYSQKIKGINDEGALITSMDDKETLKALKKIAGKHDARIGLDIAASEFYQNKKYRMESLNQVNSPSQHLEFVQDLIDQFNLVYIEDPFDQDDFKHHARLTARNPDTLICGDDLFTTNKNRLEKGITNQAGNSIIIKPNQIGTVTEAQETVQLAKKENYTPVISHRSGETIDSTISDLSIEWETPIIKAGIADIRIAKLNKLMRLWDQKKKPEINQKIKNESKKT